jgi:hypothetical protein
MVLLVDTHGSKVISSCAGFLTIALADANNFVISSGRPLRNDTKNRWSSCHIFSPSQQSGTDQSPSQHKRQQTGACQTPSQQKRQQSGEYTSEGNKFSNQLRKENKGNIDGHVDCDIIMKRKTPSWQQKSQQRGANTSEGKKLSNQLKKENNGTIDGHFDCDIIMKRKTPSWQQKSQQRGANTSGVNNLLRKENKDTLDGHVDCCTILKWKTPSQQKSQHSGANVERCTDIRNGTTRMFTNVPPTEVQSTRGSLPWSTGLSLTEIQSAQGLLPWSTGQPLSNVFYLKHLLVLLFKYYFRGRDAAASQLLREKVSILLLSISRLYDPDHPYFRLRGSVRIFTAGISILGPIRWLAKRLLLGPDRHNSAALLRLL